MSRVRSLVVVVLLMTLTGCGIPQQEEPTVIDPANVPFGLLSSTDPTSRPDTRVELMPTSTTVYFVAQDRLSGVHRDIGVGPASRRLAAVLRALLQGPSDSEQARGLTSAIPPGLRLRLVSLVDRTATIDLSGDVAGLSAEQGTLTVAQVVLSVVALPGVDRVQLTSGGRPIEAPLGDGSLTSEPLTADGYLMLVDSGPDTDKPSPRPR
jgi:spore germination protein GerM